VDGVRQAPEVSGDVSTQEWRGTEGQSLDEGGLIKWGWELGASLVPPRVIALSGELGAGKTTLVRAICAGYGVKESVTSPTFALIHRYESERSSVFHIDLYRLAGERESAQLGLEELFGSKSLILLEWPERALSLLPDNTVWIRLAHNESDPALRDLSAR
jgi:tRNA threonylcarbamoyladenosine biosynthesis protein TsaE